jgi:hypothetical protein
LIPSAYNNQKNRDQRKFKKHIKNQRVQTKKPEKQAKHQKPQNKRIEFSG